MIHPLLLLIATQPQLLADHVEVYSELVAAEIGNVSAAWKRKTMLNLVALCCLGVAAILAGVALMLWAAIPEGPRQAFWVLIVVPLAPIAVASGCLLAARPQGDGNPFDNVRQQVKADMAMLREVSKS